MLNQLPKYGWFKQCDIQDHTLANASVFVDSFALDNSSHRVAEVAFLIACIIFKRVQEGHSFVSVTQLQTERWFDGSENIDENQRPLPGIQVSDIASSDEVMEALSCLSCKQCPTHLIQYNERLFFSSYFALEQRLGALISRHINVKPIADEPTVKALLDTLFSSSSHSDSSSSAFDWQKIAVSNALNQQFSIINGGPGTGKTYTAARLLVCLLALAPALKIALAAPTGKAAQRLSESLQHALQSLPEDDNLQRAAKLCPSQATTIHTLIGTRPNVSFTKHHAQALLPYDVIVIDEVSMLDMFLAKKLLSACAHDTRIILLGDDAQLPSVESGNILKQLMGKNPVASSASSAKWLRDTCQIDMPITTETRYDPIITLQTNRRSSALINQLASAVNAKNVEEVTAVLVEAQKEYDMTFESDNFEQSTQQLVKHIYTHFYAKCLGVETAKEALMLFNECRVLCAIRKGPFGVEGLNQAFIKLAYPKAYQSTRPWFHGLPIIITQNDPLNGLNNGDLGIVWSDGIDDYAYIDRQDKDPIKLSQHRISHYEPVYAMTIHKAQGSEFLRAVIVLPETHVPLCHKELLFTGITRAKSHVHVHATSEVLKKTVDHSLKRDSALNEFITW